MGRIEQLSLEMPDEWGTEGRELERLIFLLRRAAAKSGQETFADTQPSSDWLSRKAIEVSTLINLELAREQRESLESVRDAVDRMNQTSTRLMWVTIGISFAALLVAGLSIFRWW